MYSNRNTYLCALVILLLSCNKEDAPDCFKRAGDSDLVLHTLERFDQIELRDYIFYELVQDNSYAVEIEGPANLIGKIETEISGDRLRIRNRNTCNFVRSFRHRIVVRIHAPFFSDIQNYATGDVVSAGEISGPHFKIENRNAAGLVDIQTICDSVSILTHTGVCDVRLRGAARQVNLFAQGVGYIDASQLHAEEAYVNNSSINWVHARASNYLYAFIQFKGDVLVSGQPQVVETERPGTGKLIFLPE